MERRGHVVWDMQVVESLIAREAAVRRLHHRLAFVFAEVIQAGHLQSVGDHGHRDALRSGILQSGPQNSGKECRTEAKPCEMGHEPASRFIETICHSS
jgi:hypothetical protein